MTYYTGGSTRARAGEVYHKKLTLSKVSEQRFHLYCVPIFKLGFSFLPATFIDFNLCHILTKLIIMAENKHKRGVKISESERKIVSSVEHYLSELQIKLTSFCRDNKIYPKTLPCRLHKLNEELS